MSVWFRKLMFLTAVTFSLVLPGKAQVTSISHSWGAGPVSRGSMAEIRGRNLAERIEGITTIANIPTVLGGVSVHIDGVPCQLYYVSPTLIQLVIPDEIPQPQVTFIPRRPVRIAPNVAKVSGFMTHEYKFYLTDTAPWWNLSNGYPQGIVISPTPPFLFAVIEKGVIPVSEGSRVRLVASGARSFRSPELVFYKILFLPEGGSELLETPCEVFKDPVIPGSDLVTWDIPIEWKGKKGWIYLQTPSNFSEGAPVEFQ